MTEQEEFEFRARFEAEQKAAQQQPAPTSRQKLIASTPMRLLQGMRDPIDGGAQMLPRGLEFLTSAGGLAPNRVSDFFGSEAQRVDQGISEAEREYENAKKATGFQGTDFARLGGNVVSPVNLAIAARTPALATTTQRVFGGGALGALGGLTTPVDTANNPDFAATKAGQTVLGAAAGGVATPIMGKFGDWIGQKLASMKGPQVITLNQTTEEFARASGLDWDNMPASQRQALFQEVAKASQQYAGTDPRVAQRIADFKQLDMPYTLGQITRDPLQFASEKNLTQMPGVGDRLRERFTQQGAQLQQRLGNFGAGAAEAPKAGETLITALQKIDTDMGDKVSKAYQAAKQSAGKDVEIPLQGLAQDFAEVLDNFADKVPTAVRNNFAKYGIGPDSTSMTQRKLFTVEEADRLLKIINANQSSDRATNAALSALRGAVKKAVTQDGGADDVFAPARKLAAQRFSLQDAIPALDAAASGNANPDLFVRNYILSQSASTPKVQKLASLLKENDPAAFQEARQQIGAYLNLKAFGENVAGDSATKQDRLARALREFGTEKLSAFFSPDEVAQMQRISRVAAYIDGVPNASKPNTSGNWGAVMGLANIVPGVPAAIAAGGALRGMVSNQLTANAALAAKPTPQMTPEQIRYLTQILSGGALAAGSSQAQQLK